MPVAHMHCLHVSSVAGSVRWQSCGHATVPCVCFQMIGEKCRPFPVCWKVAKTTGSRISQTFMNIAMRYMNIIRHIVSVCYICCRAKLSSFQETEPYETDDTPVLTEEDIAQLQEEDVDTEPYTSDHSHFVDIDGTVFVPLGPKVQAAPDFGSYGVTGFKQFDSILPRMDRSSQRQNQSSLKKS